jgi:hypothetical protein
MKEKGRLVNSRIVSCHTTVLSLTLDPGILTFMEGGGPVYPHIDLLRQKRFPL